MNAQRLTENQTQILDQLLEAQDEGRLLTSFQDQFSNFDIEDAYEIQAEMADRWMENGKQLTGYKMGLTSRAKQESMGISSSIYGRLFAPYIVSDNGSINLDKGVQPRVEPEIGLKIDQPLTGPVTGLDVLHASSCVFPCIEVLDSRFKDYNFSLPDVIADNTSAFRVVLGPSAGSPQVYDLESLGVVLRKNGRVVATGATGATLGNPLNAAAELVNVLSQQGRDGLKPGMIVITGGITDAVSVSSGDYVQTSIQQIGTMELDCN